MSVVKVVNNYQIANILGLAIGKAFSNLKRLIIKM